jgi:hypothetical protein
VTLKRLDKLNWGRTGRPVSRADRKVLLKLIRKHEKQTTTEAAVEQIAAQVATRRDGLGMQTGVTASRGRPPPQQKLAGR